MLQRRRKNPGFFAGAAASPASASSLAGESFAVAPRSPFFAPGSPALPEVAFPEVAFPALEAPWLDFPGRGASAAGGLAEVAAVEASPEAGSALSPFA